MMKRTTFGLTLALALAAGPAAFAQPADEGAPAAPPVAALCGASFTESGATSNVAYAAGQLRACDQLIAEAATTAELNAASEATRAAHAGVLARWMVVDDELVAASSSPDAPRVGPRRPEREPAIDIAPITPPGEELSEEEAAAAEAAAAAAAEAAAAEAAAAEAAAAEARDDPWSRKHRERHALETAMDGLRILMRVAYQMSDTYADPASILAELEEDQADLIPDILAARQVCVSAGRQTPVGGRPATAPSWYAFAEFERDFTAEEAAEPVEYGREVGDRMAALAETYVETELATAPDLGVTRLQSFATKARCPRRDFPSDDPES